MKMLVKLQLICMNIPDGNWQQILKFSVQIITGVGQMEL